MKRALALVCLLAVPAAAQEVPVHHFPAASLSLAAGYEQPVKSDHFGGLRRAELASLRSRLHFGGSVAWCTGFDGQLGGGSTGLLYQAELYLAGLTLRDGDNLISLCGGAGLGGIHHAMPFAWQFPVELSGELQLGPIRLLGFAQAAWTAGSAARKHGSGLGADEVTAGLAIRFGANTRYWGKMRAGSGPYLGVTLQRAQKSSIVGGVLGLDFWGGE